MEADQKLHDDLQAQIKQQQLTESISGSGLRITNRATPNPAPVYPNVRNNVVLALLFSLFGGCALAILAGYLDRSFTAPDAVEQYLRIPLLGALPVMSDRDNLIDRRGDHLPTVSDAAIRPTRGGDRRVEIEFPSVPCDGARRFGWGDVASQPLGRCGGCGGGGGVIPAEYSARGRVLVWPLGSELHLRHLVGALCAQRGRG